MHLLNYEYKGVSTTVELPFVVLLNLELELQIPLGRAWKHFLYSAEPQNSVSPSYNKEHSFVKNLPSLLYINV